MAFASQLLFFSLLLQGKDRRAWGSFHSVVSSRKLDGVEIG